MRMRRAVRSRKWRGDRFSAEVVCLFLLETVRTAETRQHVRIWQQPVRRSSKRQPVPCKPIFLKLFWGTVQYVEVTEYESVKKPVGWIPGLSRVGLGEVVGLYHLTFGSTWHDWHHFQPLSELHRVSRAGVDLAGNYNAAHTGFVALTFACFTYKAKT